MKRSFEERHRDTLSRLKLVLIVVCLIAIPLTFWINHHDLGSVNKRVTNVESPCVRYGPKSGACRRAFEQAVLTITHPEACAILRKAGLEIQNCVGARLRQEKGRGEERAATAEERKGVVPQHSGSPGHQQPGPPSEGGPPPSTPANPTTAHGAAEIVHEVVCSVDALGIRVCARSVP